MAVEKYSLASSVIGEKRRLIAVVSGFQTKKSRSTDSMKLISWGLRNTNTYEISEKNNPNFKVKTWLGKKEFVSVTTSEDIYITINKKDLKKLKVQANYKGPLIAPIKKGDEIGTLTVDQGDGSISSFPLYAHEEIKKVNFFKSLFLSFNYMIWGDV